MLNATHMVERRTKAERAMDEANARLRDVASQPWPAPGDLRRAVAAAEKARRAVRMERASR